MASLARQAISIRERCEQGLVGLLRNIWHIIIIIIILQVNQCGNRPWEIGKTLFPKDTLLLIRRLHKYIEKGKCAYLYKC